MSTTDDRMKFEGMKLLVAQAVANARVGMRCEYGTTSDSPLDVADAAETYASKLVAYAEDIRHAIAVLGTMSP